jgi:hypothetical protein
MVKTVDSQYLVRDADGHLALCRTRLFVSPHNTRQKEQQKERQKEQRARKKQTAVTWDSNILVVTWIPEHGQGQSMEETDAWLSALVQEAREGFANIALSLVQQGKTDFLLFEWYPTLTVKETEEAGIAEEAEGVPGVIGLVVLKLPEEVSSAATTTVTTGSSDALNAPESPAPEKWGAYWLALDQQKTERMLGESLDAPVSAMPAVNERMKTVTEGIGYASVD